MPRSFSADEWELLDIPRQLLYEQSYWGNTSPCVPQGGPDCRTVDQLHRDRYAQLLARQTELKYRIRRSAILDRWVMRRYRLGRAGCPQRATSPLTDMKVDEVIENGNIVDKR